MRTRLLSLGRFSAALLALGMVRAEVLEVYDFQNEKAGAAPSRAGLTNPARDGNEIRIVDATTTPADPSGKNGSNACLYLAYRAAEASRVPWADFPVAEKGTSLAAGTVSFALQAVSTGDTPGIIEIDLGPHTAKDVAPVGRATSIVVLQILTNNSGTQPGRFRFFSNGRWIDFQQSFPLDVMNRVAIRWSVDERTASVTLNDDPVTFDSGGAPASTLPFQNPAAEGATSFRLTAAGTSPASCFLDDLTIEPSSKP